MGQGGGWEGEGEAIALRSSNPTPALPLKASVCTQLPSFRRRRESRVGVSNNVGVQLSPLRVHGLDKCKFPGATPFLDRLFARDRRLDRLVALIPDPRMNTLFLGKAFHPIVCVLPDTLPEIRGNPHIKRPVSATGEDLNAGLLHRPRLLDSGLRRNDGSLRCVHTVALEGEGDVVRLNFMAFK